MICTAASNGVCTACNTANGLFKNPVTPQKPGGECILCHDATDRNGVMGVDNCLKCTAPGGNTGAATCTECQDGYYMDSQTCSKCDEACLTCETSATQCTSCPEGKYLKSDKTCVEAGGCGDGNYADKKTWTCKACSEIQGCTACTYNDQLQKPVCSACTTGGKTLIKTELDGTTACVDAAGCATDNVDGSHFLNQARDKCLLCSDDKTDASNPPNKGIKNCSRCKKENAGANPVCSACLEGYVKKTADNTCEACGNNCATCATKGQCDSCPPGFLHNAGAHSCTACAPNCATCSEANNPNKCTTCMPGYFPIDSTDQQGKKCVPCDSVENKGREGCSVCSNSGTFKCTDCKPNYKKQLNGDAGDDYTCVKTCEDPTACGGTAGACDAIVIDNDRVEHHYCSYCGEANKYPIDGICVDSTGQQGNTGCNSHICKSCAQGYFLYMNGCYKVGQEPGSHMCKKADKEGVCTEAAAGYFIPPSSTKDKQSVLSCGNPLGVELADQKAYVGVDGC